MKFRLALFLMIFSKIAAAQTIHHLPIPGTPCYLVPPAGFEAATSFFGFQQQSTGAVILVNEIPSSFKALYAGLTPEALSSKGMTLMDKQEVDLNGTAAAFLIVTQQEADILQHKQMLMFGIDHKTILITGVYPAASLQLAPLIRASLLSIYYNAAPAADLLGSIKFTVNLAGTDLKLARCHAGSIIYTRDGKIPTEKSYLWAGNSKLKVARNKQQQFCQDWLAKLPEGTGKQIRQTNQIRRNEMPGYEIVAVGPDSHATAELTYLTMLFEETGGYYWIVGAGREHDLEQFRSIAGTFQRGSFKTKLPSDPVDTVFSYLDSNRFETTAENACYSRQVWKTDSGWMMQSQYSGGELEMTGRFSDDSLKIREGRFRSFFRNGSVASATYYVHGSREGLSLRWHGNGQPADSANYLHDSLDGMQSWYYENGQKSEAGIYKMGSPVAVSFWTQDGQRDTAGVSGDVMPTFKASADFKDLNTYLVRTLRYPVNARDRRLMGRVVTRFVVSPEGDIRDIYVVRSSGVLDLDREAFRVINMMPAWNPGRSHNRRLPVYFTLPITFKLD